MLSPMRIPADKHESMKFDGGRIVLVVLLLAVWLSPIGARAADVSVIPGDDIAVKAALAKPGDTLVMQDGVWQDADILFSANGTLANPITLRAQTLGRVFLSGLSRL